MPKAEMAAKGEGEFAVGDWCRFCKAKNTCRARAEEYLRLAQMEFKPPELLSEEEIAEVLKVADELAKWSADVYAYTRSLVTRLYAYGADGMTFASINNGKEYVENTEYSTEIRVSTLDCSSFTNPYQMLEYTEMRLADYSKPSISYVIQVMDLSVLTGWEHESFGIGDVVTVDDKDLGIRISTRIMREAPAADGGDEAPRVLLR